MTTEVEGNVKALEDALLALLSTLTKEQKVAFQLQIQQIRSPGLPGYSETRATLIRATQ